MWALDNTGSGIDKTAVNKIMSDLTKASQYIQNFVSNSSILRNQYTYILLVLLSPIPGACAPFDSANTFQQGIISTLQITFNNIITFFQN